MRSDVFAVVMATGIISISADDHRYHLISAALAVVATAALVVLVGLVVLTVILKRRFAFSHLDDPDSALRLFTFVAACGVLAGRLEPHAFWVLGGAAVAGFLALSPIAAYSTVSRDVTQLRDGARGAWLLASVATSGIAIILADASRFTGWRLLWWGAFGIWVVAMVVYCAITSLILWRGIARGPDSWILMGGLAIAALAGNHLYRALAASSPLRDGVRVATVVIWVLASLWIPVLVYLSLRGVGARTVAAAWWAMVFPLGMYSTATVATSIDARLPILSTISMVFFWIAFAAWVVVVLAVVVAEFDTMQGNRERGSA